MQQADFHQLINENPDDREVLAVYADWLEERGDPAAAGWRWLIDNKLEPAWVAVVPSQVAGRTWLTHLPDVTVPETASIAAVIFNELKRAGRPYYAGRAAAMEALAAVVSRPALLLEEIRTTPGNFGARRRYWQFLDTIGRPDEAQAWRAAGRLQLVPSRTNRFWRWTRSPDRRERSRHTDGQHAPRHQWPHGARGRRIWRALQPRTYDDALEALEDLCRVLLATRPAGRKDQYLY